MAVKQGSVHAAARASTAALQRARKKKRKTKRNTVAAKPAAQVNAAARKQSPLKRKLHRAAHAGSAVFSAVLGLLAMSAVFLPPRESAAQPPKAELVSTPLRDIDFDGVGDFANPTDGLVRKHDHYGAGDYGASRDGGRRKHAGVDYTAKPGRLVRAPMSGQVTRVGEAYNRRSGLNFVEIHDPVRNLYTRVFYVAPSVRAGDVIAAGDEIGAAQDLTRRYPAGITNHVHVEILDERGVRVDPTLLLPLPSQELAAAEDGGATAR